MQKWLNKDVLLISFSAFFSDLGYHTAIALFPIFLVITLKVPDYEFGFANAVAFGGGAIIAYFGGLLGDKYSYKWLAVSGNAFIPLLSLFGLVTSPVIAIFLFSGGWWARNFRTPPRRALLVRSTFPETRGKVFGFLHMLDIGGGMISIFTLLSLILIGLGYTQILLLSVIPLLIATILLLFTADIKGHSNNPGIAGTAASNSNKDGKVFYTPAKKSAYKGIIIAASLYGFSSYAIGFPILTIAQRSNDILGIGSYALYLGVSAVIGFWIGSKKMDRVKTLGILGYLLSGFGTIMLGLAYFFHQSLFVFYVAVAILGFALGIIEVIEPTLISFLKDIKDLGKGMGSLTASRSLGIFLANLIMGFLYIFNPLYSYTYAGLISIAAAIIVLYYGKAYSLKI